MGMNNTKLAAPNQYQHVMVVLDSKKDDRDATVPLHMFVSLHNTKLVTLVVSTICDLERGVAIAKTMGAALNVCFKIFVWDQLSSPLSWEAEQFAGVNPCTLPVAVLPPIVQYLKPDAVVVLAPCQSMFVKRPGYFVDNVVYLALGYNAGLVVKGKDPFTVTFAKEQLLAGDCLKPEEEKLLEGAATDMKELTKLLTGKELREAQDRYAMGAIAKVGATTDVRLWHSYLAGIRGDEMGGQLTRDSAILQCLAEDNLFDMNNIVTGAKDSSDYQARQFIRYVYDLAHEKKSKTNLWLDGVATTQGVKDQWEDMLPLVRQVANRDDLTPASAPAWHAFYHNARVEAGPELDDLLAIVQKVLVPQKTLLASDKALKKLLLMKVVSAEESDLVSSAGSLFAEQMEMKWTKGTMKLSDFGIVPGTFAPTGTVSFLQDNDGGMGYTSRKKMEDSFCALLRPFKKARTSA